jgi:hypothetical protein
MKKPSNFFAKRIFYRVTALAICATVFWGAYRIEAWRSQKDTSRITTSTTLSYAKVSSANVPLTGDPAIEVANGVLAGRPLYPYSVIPGGVASIAELRNAVVADPSVASHYADFNLSQARISTVSWQRRAYVSYRIGAEIFWTSKTLFLRPGEALITDGVHEARTRCGNRISATPQSPVSSQEPAIAAFDAAANSDALDLPIGPDSVSRKFPSLDSIPDGLPFAERQSDSPGLPVPPPQWQGPGSPPIIPWGPLPPVIPGAPSLPKATPEPGTGLMLLLTLPGGWLIRKIGCRRIR